MTIDFSKLSVPQAAKPQVDPYKIFTGLPRLGGAPNDLWRGQSEALSAWHDKREKSDVLISLNTGAGKTLVGLLIAKSFVNEGLDNVLYICPTNDLVNQTAVQARSIGITVTTRVESNFDNDLFESGKTFCITNYSSIFNGLSSLRRRNFPDAIIFDDAHVAESVMRDSFSMSLTVESHRSLFLGLVSLFQPHFRALGREGEFIDSIDSARPSHSVLIPPDVVASVGNQVETLFREAGASNDGSLKYAYHHLRDHLSTCAIVITHGKFEFTPPFLPSLSLNIFDSKIRRVYLSATLNNKADIVRAFGRMPSVVIEPNNDAGNGERLIIFEREVSPASFDSAFATRLQGKHKVLVAVPSYHKAREWSSVAVPPRTDNFSEELDVFRRSSGGAFILVNRVDGIDLPHDACRLMIMDGIPRSEGLLERYQFEYLTMRTFAASRIANRLVQLFGRINRGRSDYGAFLVAGRELNTWLSNDKHVALLPELLRKQVLLGRYVQDGMNIKSLDSVDAVLDTVIRSQPRDPQWLGYYGQFIESMSVSEERSERAKRVELQNLEAAKAEAIYAKAMWNRDYQGARNALDEIVASTARADEKLAGWHNLWIGAALSHEGDHEQASFYFSRAKGQLGVNLIVSTGNYLVAGESPVFVSKMMAKVSMITNLGRESFGKQLRNLEADLSALSGGTPAQMEEATRLLGEWLGFAATRPDNDVGTGPDVLWTCEEERLIVGLELKTDKTTGSMYSKDDVSQALDHLSWMNDHSEGRSVVGVVLIGPAEGYHSQANPTGMIFQAEANHFVKLRDRLVALLRDAYEKNSTERSDFVARSIEEFKLGQVAKGLTGRPLRQA